MSDLNSRQNRLVWFDIPVANLERASAFYRAVLAIDVQAVSEPGSFAVLHHEDGNGGCLIPNAGEITSDRGILVYLNAEGRIRDAIEQVERLGGRVLEPLHPIGPHGFRAIVLDSEGNRIALHSSVNA
jgi:predicted enzyme related to lactoylglutathione lyase